MSISVRLVNQDENYRLARVTELKIGGKHIEAPKRALAGLRSGRYRETSLRNSALHGFVEVFRRLKPDKIRVATSRRAVEAELGYQVSSALRGVKDEEIVLGIIEYRAEGLPEREEVEFLADLLNHRRFDLVVPPIIPKLPPNEYMSFLDSFVDACETTTLHPSLVPYIPHYSRIVIRSVLDYYMNKDVFEKNFICVDFNGSNPISQYTFVSMIIREARRMERELDEPVFLHALNLKYGKATKKQTVVPAKDLLVFSLGFDCFGPNHKQVFIPEGLGREYEPKTKLLNRKDYGYYSLSIFPQDVDEEGYEVKLRDVQKDGKLARLFNAERQGLETGVIRQIIKEDGYMQYLNSKDVIKQNEKILKVIRKVQNDVTQRTLA